MKKIILRLALVALSALVLDAGCAAPRPYYSGFRFDAPTLVETDRSEMVIYLDWVIKSKRLKSLTMVTPGDGEQSIYPRNDSSPAMIDWLPLPILFAARFVLNPKLKGLEVDLMVRTAAEGYTPVTALHEVNGNVRIEMGPPLQSLLPAAESLPTREALTKRFGIGAVRDGEQTWQPGELYALEQALTLLSQEERAVIAGVSFVRHHRPEKAVKGLPPEKIWGLYHGATGKQGGREIHLFDTTEDHDAILFIGEPRHPYPSTTMCLLHEIGHAVADYARIESYRVHAQQFAAHDKLVKQWNELHAAAQLTSERAAELDRQIATVKADAARSEPHHAAIKRQYEREQGPVHSAYLVARGPQEGPTPYGHTDVEESFAEAFALFKADPAALRRIYPELQEWFAAGHHMQVLRDAIGEAAPSASLSAKR